MVTGLGMNKAILAVGAMLMLGGSMQVNADTKFVFLTCWENLARPIKLWRLRKDCEQQGNV